MFLLLVVFALLVGASGEANFTFPGGHFTGRRATMFNFPFQISVSNLGYHICSGVIVNEFYALTVAHCLDHIFDGVDVRSGSTLLDWGGFYHRVEKFIRHEKYSKNSYGVPVNDIALLRVKEPFKFDDEQQSVQFSYEALVPDVMMNLTGWGERKQKTQLQRIEIPIISNEFCNKTYEAYGGIQYAQVCSAYFGEGEDNICNGESGAPLTHNKRLFGLLSWGMGCAEPRGPGVYTRVLHYVDWIEKVMKSESRNECEKKPFFGKIICSVRQRIP